MTPIATKTFWRGEKCGVLVERERCAASNLCTLGCDGGGRFRKGERCELL